MEKLNKQKVAVTKALKKFGYTSQKFVAHQPKSTEEYEELRDSLIQRFEFSTDIFWKFLMLYMTDSLEITVEVASPKQVMRTALEHKLLTPEEYNLCIKMINDRNLTSHTYNEELAEEISQTLPTYSELLHELLKKLA